MLKVLTFLFVLNIMVRNQADSVYLPDSEDPTNPESLVVPEKPSNEETPALVEENPVPEEENPAWVEESPALVKENPSPVEETPAPIDENPALVEENMAHVEETPAPTEENQALVEENPAHVEENPAPTEENQALVEENPAHVEETSAPIEENQVLVEENPAPVEENPALVEENPASVEENPTLVEVKPNIIFILADDLGWADVSWNEPQILSPNLQALYSESLVLQNYYVQAVCTPSRAALMTGRYPFHLGLQSGQITYTQPDYLPLNVSTIPEKLKEQGYTTHAIGKWHLGFCKKEATPTYRGFDTFYGMWLGAGDYFTHCKKVKGLSRGYLDFHDNMDNVYDQEGVYSVHSHTARAVKIIEEHNTTKPLYLYLSYQGVHFPLQVPQQYKDMNRRIGYFTGKRRYKGAMVTALDEGVGNVTAALKVKGLYDKAIIVFSSDNGGAVQTASFNYPYRGSKGTLYEGGTKVVGMIRGPQFHHSNYTGLFHAVDWYPTLLRAAGAAHAGSGLDGVDLWAHLIEGSNGRNEFVYNINEVKGRAAIRVGRYKLLLGQQGSLDYWYTDLKSVTLNRKTSKLATVPIRPGLPDPYHGAMLFDLESDPYEYNDLSDQMPEVVERLYLRLKTYYNTVIPSIDSDVTDAADPVNYNGTWSPGWC